jgi:hypothetical protein
MSDKFITGYSRKMDYPLEDALESFLIENTEWILSQDAVVEWCIVERPWAEAVLFVTPPADVRGKSDEKRSSDAILPYRIFGIWKIPES